MKATKCSSLSLSLFPPELKLEVFARLPTLSDVRSLACTSNAFHGTLEENEGHIACAVICHQINNLQFHRDHIREILAVARSSTLSATTYTRERVVDQLRDYFEVEPQLKGIQWTMPLGNYIEALLFIVPELADEFAQAAPVGINDDELSFAGPQNLDRCACN